MIEIRVIGLPAPQGSKSFKGIRGGKAILAESSKNVKPWREAVKWAAREAMQPRAYQGICGAVTVEMVFTMPKPKSAPKTYRTWPDRQPDLDKLCRSTLDSLVMSGAIEDDARVVSLLARKAFPLESKDALDVPGAVIRIRSVEAK